MTKEKPESSKFRQKEKQKNCVFPLKKDRRIANADFKKTGELTKVD